MPLGYSAGPVIVNSITAYDYLKRVRAPIIDRPRNAPQVTKTKIGPLTFTDPVDPYLSAVGVFYIYQHRIEKAVAFEKQDHALAYFRNEIRSGKCKESNN